jgi:hypothetical protein
MNIICLFFGVWIGQKTSKGEVVEVKNPLEVVNPVKLYRDSQEKRVAQKEQDKLNTILDNIENYNGTSIGQKDVR